MRHSKDRQIIAIELVKDHLFGDPDFKTIEIVLLRVLPSSVKLLRGQKHHQLMQTKVTKNLERGALYDFQLSDEIASFPGPIIFFMHSTRLDLISTLTNKVVKTVDFSTQLVGSDSKLFKSKIPAQALGKGVFDWFDKIHLSHYLEVYLASSKMDCMFFLKFEDQNDFQDLQ